MGAPSCATFWTFSERARAAVLALFLLVALPAALPGQTLRVEGDLEHPAATLLREILARDRFQVLRRDTILPRDFHAPNDLVVLGADVRLEGRVEGSVAVIEGDLFLRPGAHIGGRLVTVAGGAVYRSTLATFGEILEVPPQARVRAESTDSEYRLTLLAPPGPPLLQLGGLFGVGLPSYDRVDGLTLRAGGQANLGRDSLGAVATAMVTFGTARNAVGGAVALEYPLRPRVWLRAQATRATMTNEEWIRGTLVNSLATVALGSDARNYFRSDEVSATLSARPRQPLIEGEGRLVPRLTLRASRDRSLEAQDPWSLFGDDPWRENPPIDEGTLASVVAGTGAEFQGRTLTFAGDAALEWAPGVVGDFAFAQLVTSARWTMQALWRHSIDLAVHTRQTLGSAPAPRQRWSFVGGSATLPTVETGSLRGDRLVLALSTYLIPLPRPALPFLGPPSLRVEHGVGSAWVAGTELPRWEQSLGAGLDFRLVRAMIFIDPARGLRAPRLNLSAGLPF